MPKPSPTSGAVIFAKDIKRMSEFYCALLDLSVVHSGGDHVVIESDRAALVIHGIPPRIAKTIEITSPPKLREATTQKLFFVVKSIEVCRKVAPDFGGKLQAKSKEWSARNFTACDGNDPEGNIFQVREIAA